MLPRHYWSFFVLVSVVIWVFPGAAIANPVIDADRQRIQAHLAEVEAELRDRDVSHLSEELQQARTDNLDVLREYKKAGEFPHNTHVPWRHPVFIDRDGRACAVGHLMIESGWDDEAQRIHERENLAYLPDMNSPEVEEWVTQSGLTPEEAAWIQPSYSPCMNCSGNSIEPVCGDDGKTYINDCVVEHCYNVERWHDGCCSANDEIEKKYDTSDCFEVSGQNHDDVEGNDVEGNDGEGNDGENDGADSDDRVCDVCPEGTISSQVPDGDWYYSSTPDGGGQPGDRACATTTPVTGGVWLAMLAFLMLAWRRFHRNRVAITADAGTQ